MEESTQKDSKSKEKRTRTNASFSTSIFVRITGFFETNTKCTDQLSRYIGSGVSTNTGFSDKSDTVW